jgi:hypothetical protein
VRGKLKPRRGEAQVCRPVAALLDLVVGTHPQAGPSPPPLSHPLYARRLATSPSPPRAARERGAARWQTVYRRAELRELTSQSPPPPRTKWTRRVPHPVLIGHAARPSHPRPLPHPAAAAPASRLTLCRADSQVSPAPPLPSRTNWTRLVRSRTNGAARAGTCARRRTPRGRSGRRRCIPSCRAPAVGWMTTRPE